MFAGLGFIASRKQVLEFIAPMSPLNSLFMWYILFGGFLTLLGYWVLSARWDIKYTVALLMVTWAFGIVLYWPISGYSTSITGAHLTGVEDATEDAVTYSFLLSLGIHDTTGIITYAIVPFLLIVLAGWIVAPAMFSRIVRSLVGRS